MPVTTPCSFIGIAGREVEAKWDDNGAGAVFFFSFSIILITLFMITNALSIVCLLPDKRASVSTIKAPDEQGDQPLSLFGSSPGILKECTTCSRPWA